MEQDGGSSGDNGDGRYNDNSGSNRNNKINVMTQIARLRMGRAVKGVALVTGVKNSHSNNKDIKEW